jgi:type VI secretion system secreted protein Hcp
MEGCVLMGRKLRLALAAVVASLGVAAVPAQAPAAQDMFLQIDGIQGESTTEGFENAIGVLAWSWGASNGGNGKSPSFQALSVTKYIDRTSPTLFANMAAGRVMPAAKLTVIRTGGERPVPYLRLCLTGVRAESVSTGGSGGEERLTENVTFSYATVVEAYQGTDAEGKLTAPVFGGWDLVGKMQYSDTKC